MDDSKNVLLQGGEGTGLPSPGQPAGTEPTAVASFACATISVLGLLAGMAYFPFVFLHLLFPAAIFYGHRALRRLQTRPGTRGYGMAMFGLVIGYFELLLSAIALLTVILAIRNAR